MSTSLKYFARVAFKYCEARFLRKRNALRIAFDACRNGEEKRPLSLLDYALLFYLPKNYEKSPLHSFDSKWYRNTYQDVAGSDIHPFLHYIKSGRLEGRLPAPNRALYLDAMLWSGPSELAQSYLQFFLDRDDLSIQETLLARWALCRRLLFVRELKQAFAHAQALMSDFRHWERAHYRRYFLLCIDTAIQVGEVDIASDWLMHYENALSDDTEIYLVKINLLAALNRLPTSKWCREFNSLLSQRDLLPVAFREDKRRIECLTAKVENNDVKATARVSIVVPMFNAEHTISYVLDCLDNQTWSDIEVLICDDCSTDNSVQVVEDWINNRLESEGRVWKLLTATENAGAYAVRNKGIASATGDFLTVNDADDWAHPQKVALQVQSIIDKSCLASVSSMARVLPDLCFHCWRLEERWIFRNVSSLMIKRKVLETLGYWDEIKAGADTEYYYRLIAAFGEQSIEEVLPDIPLSLQLVRENSLTQSSATHASTQFKGARKLYLEAAYDWHANCSSVDDFYLSGSEINRPFYCPSALLSHRQFQPTLSKRQQLAVSTWWDADWYTQRYADLHTGSLDPEEHFLSKGIYEERDPGPGLSLSGLRFGLDNPDNSVEFAQLLNISTPYHPIFAGQQGKQHALNVLLVGHQAGNQLYGAERSLMDMVVMLNQSKINVHILLPEAVNKSYVNELRKHCVEVKIIPYGWWFKGKQANQATVDAICEYINLHKIHIVHINTLVLHEPLLAAKNAKVSLIVHVREDLASDPDLQKALLTTPREAHERLQECGAHILCNSKFMVGNFLSALPRRASNISFVYNAIDISDLQLVSKVQNDRVSVGMVSSNIAKKGLSDFFQVAKKFEDNRRVIFKVYGPNTSELERCFKHYRPTNIEYGGYAKNIITALNQLDVILSLSKFKESFGRTVAEGQASGKIVIAYNKGAPAELIDDGVTGFLVEEEDYEKIKEVLLYVCENNSALSTLRQTAQKVAAERFSYENCANQLISLYHSLKAPSKLELN